MYDIIKIMQENNIPVKVYSSITGITDNVKLQNDNIIVNNAWWFTKDGYLVSRYWISDDGTIVDGTRVSKNRILYFDKGLNPIKSLLDKIPMYSIIHLNNRRYFIFGKHQCENEILLNTDGNCLNIKDISDIHQFEFLNNDEDEFLNRLINNCEVVMDLIRSSENKYGVSTKVIKYFLNKEDNKYPKLIIQFRSNGGFFTEIISLLDLSKS